MARQYKYRALVRLDPETADSALPRTGVGKMPVISWEAP